MHCPIDLELARWSEGALPGDRARELAGHLAECLECRLVAREATAAGRVRPGPGETQPRLPSFEEVLPALRMAHAAVPCDESPQRHQPAAEEDESPLMMAADSDLQSRTATIPSFLGEDGRLVVTFRVDPDTATATAHFVSRDLPRTRCRALRVGDEILLSDVDGRVELAGYSPDEILGMRISVPPSLCEGKAELPLNVGTGERVSIPLLDAAGRPAAFRVEAQLCAGPEGGTISLTLMGDAPRNLGAVLIGDEARARLVRWDDSSTAAIEWELDLPKQIRITILDLA